MGITANFGSSTSTGGDVAYGTLGTYKYVQGDTGPQMRFTFTDEDTGLLTDLTGALVTLRLRPTGGSVVLTRELFINPETATNGEAIVIWQEGDLNVTPGTYEAEIEVLLASGVRETLFDVVVLRIRADF
tara:strand:+ start:1707 stop:2096 length:390 start_codon:yes stop_codon:yes gene_type:complete